MLPPLRIYVCKHRYRSCRKRKQRDKRKKKSKMNTNMMELDMKALNMNELSFNELEQISGGMSLFEFLIRQSRQNEDD